MHNSFNAKYFPDRFKEINNLVQIRIDKNYGVTCLWPLTFTLKCFFTITVQFLPSGILWTKYKAYSEKRIEYRPNEEFTDMWSIIWTFDLEILIKVIANFLLKKETLCRWRMSQIWSKERYEIIWTGQVMSDG